MTKPVIHVASTEPSRVELAQINLWYAGAHAVTHKTLE